MKVVTSSGIQQRVDAKDLVFPEKKEGQHLWVVGAVWKVMRPDAETMFMDIENLLFIDGPGCWWCEERYTKDRASQPCQGGGSNDM